MAYKMPFEPQHPTILHPWGCPCSLMIERTLCPKGVEQFGHSSQEKDLGYERYLVLLVQEQPILVVLVKKKGGVTKANLGRTRGCVVRTRDIVSYIHSWGTITRTMTPIFLVS